MSLLFSSKEAIALKDATELAKAWNALNNAPSTAGLVGAHYTVQNANPQTHRVPDVLASTPNKMVYRSVTANLFSVTLGNGLEAPLPDEKNTQLGRMEFLWNLQQKKTDGLLMVSQADPFSDLVNVTDDHVEFPTPLGVAPANTNTVYVAYENAAGDAPVVFKMPLLSFRRSVVPTSWDAAARIPNLYGGLAENGKTKQPAPAPRTGAMGQPTQSPQFAELNT